MNGAEGSRESRQPGIDDGIRHQLARLARRRGARVTEFRRDRPTDWRPQTVSNPNSLLDPYFTDSGAWELIATTLERGHPVEVVTLRKPPGATGYVMMIDLETDQPPIYVKLQLGAGKIIGRSFHHSEHQRRTS
jgi:hypothetical protein